VARQYLKEKKGARILSNQLSTGRPSQVIARTMKTMSIKATIALGACDIAPLAGRKRGCTRE